MKIPIVQLRRLKKWFEKREEDSEITVKKYTFFIRFGNICVKSQGAWTANGTDYSMVIVEPENYNTPGCATLFLYINGQQCFNMSFEEVTFW